MNMKPFRSLIRDVWALDKAANRLVTAAYRRRIVVGNAAERKAADRLDKADSAYENARARLAVTIHAAEDHIAANRTLSPAGSSR